MRTASLWLIEEEGAGLVDGEVVELVGFGFGQVDDAFDVLVHGLSSSARTQVYQGGLAGVYCGCRERARAKARYLCRPFRGAEAPR